MKTGYVGLHLKIKKMMQKILENTGSKCLPVGSLAKELKKDPRIVRNHLEVMEFDGLGELMIRKNGYFWVIYDDETKKD